MLGGSKCASGSTASTIIDFICDKSVFSAGEPRLLAQLPPGDNEACSFFVEWRTHVRLVLAVAVTLPHDILYRSLVRLVRALAPGASL